MNKRKLISVILIFCMVITLVPGSAFIGTASAAATKPAIINAETFPDKIFREYVRTFDLDDDGILSIDELNNVTYMSVASEPITTLKGLGYFKNLQVFNCAECKKIKSMNMRYNPELRQLYCWEATNLTSLSVSKNTKLEVLDCSYSGLRSVNMSDNLALKKLNCAGCYLTELPLTKNQQLEFLDCSENCLTSLDLSQNTNLIEMTCWSNPLLKKVNFSRCRRLEIIDCSECVELENFDISDCINLKKLECWSDYKVTELNLLNNKKLEYLDCSYNEITQLDLTQNENLLELNCEHCNLTALDISCNPRLENVIAGGNGIETEMPVVWFSQLSNKFDPSKVSYIRGGMMDEKSQTFKFINSKEIKYNYEIAPGKKETFTMVTSYEIAPITPRKVSGVGLESDYGIIKIYCNKNDQEGASYRFAYRETGTKKWKFINTTKPETVITKLQKNVLYDVAAANVLGGERSAYVYKKIYTNRSGTGSHGMFVSRIEKTDTKNGSVKIWARDIHYKTEPKHVTYRYAYRPYGTKKWTYLEDTSNIKTIKGLTPGKTYTFAVAYLYKSNIDKKTTVASKYSKYVNIKVK